MAHIGMKRPVAGKLGEDGTYSEGFVVGKAINFTGTPTNNDVELWADDEWPRLTSLSGYGSIPECG